MGPAARSHLSADDTPQVTEITLDYTDCEDQSPQTSTTANAFTTLSSFNYRLRAGHSADTQPPQYMFVNRTSDNTVPVSQQKQCVVQFDVPYELDHTVLLYYKMTNFYQNHRRYVKSVDPNQLKGDHVSAHDIQTGDCKPLTTDENGKIYYPCGLIANSVFNGQSPRRPAARTFVLTSPNKIRFVQRPDSHEHARQVIQLVTERYCMARRGEQVHSVAELQPRRDHPPSELGAAVPERLHELDAASEPEGGRALPELDEDRRSADLHEAVGAQRQRQPERGALPDYRRSQCVTHSQRHELQRFLTHLFLSRYRLSREAVPWDEVHRDLDCVMDRRQEPLPRLGVRRHRSTILPPCRCRYDPTPNQA